MHLLIQELRKKFPVQKLIKLYYSVINRMCRVQLLLSKNDCSLSPNNKFIIFAHGLKYFIIILGIIDSNHFNKIILDWLSLITHYPESTMMFLLGTYSLDSSIKLLKLLLLVYSCVQ